MKRFTLLPILLIMVFLFGCTTTKKTTTPLVQNDTVATTSTTDGQIEVKSTPLTSDVTTSTPSTDPAKTAKIAKLQAGFKYVQMSYDSIMAGVEKLKSMSDPANSNNKYQVIITKIYPYLIKLGEIIATYNAALQAMDPDAAMNAYNIGRPIITTILKQGGPLLMKFIF